MIFPDFTILKLFTIFEDNSWDKFCLMYTQVYKKIENLPIYGFHKVSYHGYIEQQIPEKNNKESKGTTAVRPMYQIYKKPDRMPGFLSFKEIHINKMINYGIIFYN